MQPAYLCYDRSRSKDSPGFVIKKPGENYLDSDEIIDGRVIAEPVFEYFLSCLDFTGLAEKVFAVIKNNQREQVAKLNTKKIIKLEQKLDQMEERLLIGQFSKDQIARFQKKHEKMLEELKALRKADENIDCLPDVSIKELDLIREYLGKLQDYWIDLPIYFQERLVKLLLNKVSIYSVANFNFEVEVNWVTELIETLWIERPFENLPRKPWDDEEIAQLKTSYSDSSWRDIVQSYPGKSRDAIRAQAVRLGLKRKPGVQDSWDEFDVEIFDKFMNGVITYRTMREQLSHKRFDAIKRRAEKSGGKWPDISKINWKLVNTQTTTALPRG